MGKTGKLILAICAMALLSRACDDVNKQAQQPEQKEVTSGQQAAYGVTTVVHTKAAEEAYGLPEGNWYKAVIYSYPDGTNAVWFYTDGRECNM